MRSRRGGVAAQQVVSCLAPDCPVLVGLLSGDPQLAWNPSHACSECDRPDHCDSCDCFVPLNRSELASAT